MKRKTLFSPGVVEPRTDYGEEVRALYDEDCRSFCGNELSAFDGVTEFERHLDIDCGRVAGNLKLKVSGDVINLEPMSRGALCIPAWPEPDEVQFLKCRARRVLLIEKPVLFSRLQLANAADALQAVLVAPLGLPRYNTRRFLHRLCKRFRLPLYVIADNDTWGYFMFSLMKRGRLNPAKKFPQAAVQDTCFLGMRCADASHFKNPKEVKIPQKSYWKYRIAAMRKYDCFESKAWQQEFDAFEKQKGKFELGALIGHKGVEYVIHEYLKPKLEQQDYLK